MMKNKWRKMAVIFVAIGLVILTSACTTEPSSEKKSYEKKSYSVAADKVNQISLSTKDRKVEVKESKDNKIHITYFENKKESYDVNVTDENELTMKLVTDKNWKDYVGLDKDKTHRLIQIAVPSGISSGMEIQTSKRDISLSDLKIDGAVVMTTNGGKIDVTNVKANKNLKLKTKNDDINLKDVNIEDSIDATITEGNIKVSNVAVGNTLKMRTKNGDITGTVVGSYDVFKISSEASKGKNNLPKNKKGGDKALDVVANNGDINLEFAE